VEVIPTRKGGDVFLVGSEGKRNPTGGEEVYFQSGKRGRKIRLVEKNCTFGREQREEKSDLRQEKRS